ncbi:MAG: hypothetical protein DSZ03_04320 [Sulfurimonas sp.]|nr:MAG: hypothetical protein DSZ03_04320 [Sulfurimonas sp.]
MIYLCVAFKEEAKPLLQQWQFQRDKAAPCTLYYTDNIYLCITRMGHAKAQEALTALLTYRPPQTGDCFINFGICAAPDSFAIGEVLHCSHLFYNDRLLTLSSPATCHLRTVDTPCATPHATPVDMEAFFLFQTALAHFSRCFCIKVVSDHFQPEAVCIRTLKTLLHNGVTILKEIIHENCCCHRC